MASSSSCALSSKGRQLGPLKSRRCGSFSPEGRAMTPTTTITIRIPGALRAYCGGASELGLSAPSVRAVLLELERRHPALYGGICDETGAVRRHIGVFVNRAHIRDREGLDTTLLPGDVVTILPAVSGG